MADQRRVDLTAVVTPALTDILAVRQDATARDKRETIAQVLSLYVEANDLSAAVVWDDVPEANIPTHTGEITGDTALVLDVTAISGQDLVTAVATDMILIEDATDGTLKRADVADLIDAEVNDLSAAVTWANVPDVNITESSVTQHSAAMLTSLALELTDNSDVVTAANTDKYVMVANGTTGYVGRLLTEADIDDLQTYLTAEVNDLSAAVTWANVPEANIPTHTGDVTGQTELTIDAGAISTRDLVTAVTADMLLLWDATDSALKRCNVSDLIDSYVETNDLSAAVVWANVPQANIPDPLLMADGTVGAPSFSFANDPDSGVFSVSANRMAIVAGALDCIEVQNIGAARAIGFYTTAPIVLQTGVSVDAAGIHAALVNLGLITA